MKKKLIVPRLIVVMLLLLVFITGSSLKSFAYDHSNRDILGHGTDYTSILYDSTNGLPTSEANAICQTSDGFIWLGGYSGFIRYDGTEFYRFDSTTGISSVYSLLADSEDIVWIGSNENGLAYFDHGDIHVYGRVEGLKSHSIRALAEDENHNIIVATTQGLAYVDREDLAIHPIDDPQINKAYINEIHSDGAGNIYGLTNDGNIFVMKNLRITAFYEADKFGNHIINAIYPDPAKPSTLYAGTLESDFLVISFDNDVKVTKRYSVQPLKTVNSIAKIGDKIWTTTTYGVGYFDSTGSYFALDDIPMNNTIGNVMQDNEGNIWFTSSRQGIMKLVPDRFTDISKLAGLEKMVVNTTCKRNDLLYMGTDNGLIILDSNSDRLENELTRELEGIRIRCIKKDSQDNIWICTHGEKGLICYSKDKKITSIAAADGLDVLRVRAVRECADGSIAAATNDGLYIIKDFKVVKHYGTDSGINTLETLSVEQGPDGKLYMGSDGDGIYVVDHNKVSRIGYEDGLTSGVVMRIKWDPDRGVFWLITSNSIEYMKDGVATAITNFPYSNNYDIFFDDDGGAWVLSSSGIYITKVDELLENGDIEYTFYNTKSGLPYISTGNSRSELDEEGYLYISGTTGVCKVNIFSDVTSPEKAQLVIPAIGVDNTTISTRGLEEVSVPAGSQRITINMFAITFGLSNPRISYYLEGFDEKPIYTTKQDMEPVVYTNLDGGKYVFHLNLLNNETGAVERSTEIKIVKESSVYESILFWIILSAISVGIISFAMWRHFDKSTKLLLEKQEEDRKFIEQIMHTFAKCVDLRDTQNQGHSFRVAYYTRMLAEKLAQKRGYSKEQIDEFYHIALMHDIGKINIPDKILNKTERLDDEEYQIMKSHTSKGEELLKGVDIVPNLAFGAGYHHERLDGKGYPRGLHGNEIPEAARLIAVADTFDAMYSTRPYRKQMLLTDVMDELKRVAGTQLEAEVVEALVELANENKLNKDEVDRHIKENIYGLHEEKEKEKHEHKEKIKKQNSDFIKSLGLGKDDD